MAITKTIVLKIEDADSQYRIVRVQDDGNLQNVVVDLFYERRTKTDFDAAGAERWFSADEDAKSDLAQALVRGLDRIVSTRLVGGKARTQLWPEGRFATPSGAYNTAIVALSQ